MQNFKSRWERSRLVKEVGGPGPTYLSSKAEDLNLSSCGVSKVLAQTKEKRKDFIARELVSSCQGPGEMTLTQPFAILPVKWCVFPQSWTPFWVNLNPSNVFLGSWTGYERLSAGLSAGLHKQPKKSAVLNQTAALTRQPENCALLNQTAAANTRPFQPLVKC